MDVISLVDAASVPTELKRKSIKTFPFSILLNVKLMSTINHTLSQGFGSDIKTWHRKIPLGEMLRLSSIIQHVNY